MTASETHAVWALDPRLVEFLADRPVAQTQVRFEGQAKGHVRDDVLALQAALEDAFPVSEGAVGVREGPHVPRGDLHRLERMETLLQFHAIRTDVLHRPCPGAPGNQRQVLEAVPAAVQGGHHEVVPHDARPDPDKHRTFIAADLLDALYAEVQHEAGQVAGQQDIAAPAQDVQRRARLPVPRQGLPDGLDRSARHEVLGAWRAGRTS